MQPSWVRVGKNSPEGWGEFRGMGSVTLGLSNLKGLSCPPLRSCLRKKDTVYLPHSPSKVVREVLPPFAYDHMTIQVRNSSKDSWVQDHTSPSPCSVSVCARACMRIHLLIAT